VYKKIKKGTHFEEVGDIKTKYPLWQKRRCPEKVTSAGHGEKPVTLGDKKTVKY